MTFKRKNLTFWRFAILLIAADTEEIEVKKYINDHCHWNQKAK